MKQITKAELDALEQFRKSQVHTPLCSEGFTECSCGRNDTLRVFADHRRLVELLGRLSKDCNTARSDEAKEYLRQWEGNT